MPPMADPIRYSGTCTVREIKTRMWVLIREALQRWEGRADGDTSRSTRLEIPIEPVSPIDWIAEQKADSRMLWGGRDDGRTVAGVRIADVVVGAFRDHPGDVIDRCRRYQPAQGPAWRYYGGFSFQEEATEDSSWYKFGPSRFMLPRFEVVREGEQHRFVCNLLLREGAPINRDKLMAELDALVFPDQVRSPSIPDILDRDDQPDRAGWTANVGVALDLFEREVLDKIVLARKARYVFEAPVDAFRIMARLQHVTNHCFHFCFQPDPSVAFMGTTPERLFSRSGRAFRSEVLAGTRPRDTDPAEDEKLARELMESEKDQREHDIVRKSLRQELYLLTDALEVEEQAHLFQLERKQHLRSFIEGSLRSEVSDGDIIARLHPTPAVGGYPRGIALEEIRRLEPFCRGWYAAPVGWVGDDAAEFAVAIRSGLVEGASVSVYSGAGIVAGSDPDEEWAEIEAKIADFTKVTRNPGSNGP